MIKNRLNNFILAYKRKNYLKIIDLFCSAVPASQSLKVQLSGLSVFFLLLFFNEIYDIKGTFRSLTL